MQILSNPLTNRLAIDPGANKEMMALAKQDPNQAIKQVAGQFEAMLVNQLLSSARENSLSGEDDSSELSTYKGLVDQQLVMGLTQGGGLGMAEMLARQIEKLAHTDKLQNEPAVATLQDLPLALPAPAKISYAVGRYQSMQAGVAANPVKPPATVTDIPTDKEGFVSTLLPFASRAAEKLGVAPELLVGHAALESGWGKRSIKHPDGRESYNLFGIKANAAWGGDSVATLTTEYVNGKAQKQVESFRSYPDLQAAFDDYANLLKNSGRYQAALNRGADASAFASGLQRGGYATDPAYARKLTDVAQAVFQR